MAFPTVQNGNIIRMGIEMDLNTRKRVAYHFYAEHPYETEVAGMRFLTLSARTTASDRKSTP